MKQIGPRKVLTDKRSSDLSYRTWNGTNTKPSYRVTTAKTPVFEANKRLVYYFVDPKSISGTWPMHELSAYSKDSWELWPSVGWRPGIRLGETRINSAGIPSAPYLGNLARDVNEGAVRKLISEVNDAKVDLLTFYAERQKTADMLRHRLFQAYYALRAVKRGKIGKAVRILKNGNAPKSLRAADLRLEFVYGWKPLVQDIYGLANMPPIIQSQRIKVPYGRPFNASDAFGSENTNGSPWGIEFSSGKVSTVCIMDIELNDAFIASAARLGLSNPAVTAWELVPWSFVIDWFLPIGDYLSQFDTFNGITITDKLLISKVRYEVQRDSRYFGSSRRTYKSMVRRKSFNLNPPPRIKNPVSFDHSLNALALIRSLKGGTRGWRYG